MTLNELNEIAQKSIAETPIDPKIVLIIPADRHGNRYRLGQHGPVRNIIQGSTDGIWVIFNANAILEWCKWATK